MMEIEISMFSLDGCENQVHGEVEFRHRCCRSW